MVTGTGSERIAVEAMKLGVSDYLAKDLEGGFVNLLPLAVERAIQQRRLWQEKQQMEAELTRARRLEAIDAWPPASPTKSTRRRNTSATTGDSSKTPSTTSADCSNA